MKTTQSVKGVSHEDAVLRRLRRDPNLLSEYLQSALEDTDDPRVLLVALRRAVAARGGVTRVARQAGIERESLHRAISPGGNPRLSTLVALVRALGLRFTLQVA